MKSLPIRFHNLLQILDRTIRERGMAPSNIELASLTDLSECTVSHYKKELKIAGLITFEKGRCHTVRVTDAGQTHLRAIGAANGIIQGELPELPEPVEITIPEFIPAETLKERAIKLLVDSHTEGATDFANALGSILSLIP